MTFQRSGEGERGAGGARQVMCSLMCASSPGPIPEGMEAGTGLSHILGFGFLFLGANHSALYENENTARRPTRKYIVDQSSRSGFLAP